jgi:hypothetical protein
MMRGKKQAWHGFAISLALLVMGSGASRAGTITYLVTADSTAVNGTTGTLDFQLDPNGSTSSDSALIAQIAGGSAGAVNTPPTGGNVTGALPGNVTLVDSTPTNELNQAFTYGSSLSYQLTLSTNDSSQGGVFSFALFDANGNLLDSANGSNSGQIVIDQGAGVTIVPQQNSTIPEPASFVLLAIGVSGLMIYTRFFFGIRRVLPPDEPYLALATHCLFSPGVTIKCACFSTSNGIGAIITIVCFTFSRV